MTLPRFSLIIETANLSVADLDGLRESLESLTAQTVPVQSAAEAFIVDSGDVPPDVLEKMLSAFPWVRDMRLPPGTGYEELKMAGAQASTGEVIVFADGDCRYEPQWLESLLSPFVDEKVMIVGGETTIDNRGGYALGVSVAYSFSDRARSENLYETDRYHLNSVAFRRSVLQKVPIPSRRPCYRMTNLHVAALQAAGYTIYRQPRARARHAAPNGLTHFVWRSLLLGYDGVAVPRLIAKEMPSVTRSSTRRRKTLGLMGYWAAETARKLAAEVRRDPIRILSLPIAVPVIAGTAALQVVGAIAAIVAPERLLSAVPEEIISSSTCEPRHPA
jgi:glycosyltransferase involved in cell wall biosynthesis